MFITNYKRFISSFQSKGYNFISFDQLDLNENSQIILRHDIDVDIDLAYKMAIIEKELGIKSTYFFLLCNESYNLISDKNSAIVKSIADMGHTISLHFDMSIYKNPVESLNNELKIFDKVFQTNTDIISIHRPNKKFLNNPNNYFKIPNTYESNYVKKIKYYSDSRGSFRFGNPLESDSFNSKSNMQICIHPIWWIDSDIDLDRTIYSIVDNKKENLLKHFEKNIEPFNR